MTFALAEIDGLSNYEPLSNIYAGRPTIGTMGDPACYRNYCPECDLQVTITDEECPECGTHLPQTKE